jgi:hypothetical protein
MRTSNLLQLYINDIRLIHFAYTMLEEGKFATFQVGDYDSRNWTSLISVNNDQLPARL